MSERETVEELLAEWAEDLPEGPASRTQLVCRVKRELGVSVTPEELSADIISERLPRLATGISVVAVYETIRSLAEREMKYTRRAMKWFTPWSKFEYWIETDDPLSIFFETVSAHYPGIKSESRWHVVADVVRDAWLSLGGTATWYEPSYESHVCPTQAVFNDLEAILQYRFSRHAVWRRRRLQPEGGLRSGFRPADPIPPMTVNSRAELLAHLRDTFGVWLSDKPYREPPGWVLIAGLVAFVSSMVYAIIGGTLLPQYVLPAWSVFALVLGIWTGNSLNHVFAPKLPMHVLTLKDIVHLILAKRERKPLPPRIRPRFDVT